MRRRRVGVTARSRQNVGNQATGALQFGTEMAAPLGIENTSRHLQRKLQTECGWKHGDKGAGKSTSRRTIQGEIERSRRAYAKGESDVRRGSGALEARMRRRLKLRQGQALRPPAPFPSGTRFQNGGNRSRVRKPRNIGAPLTDSHRSEERAEMRERGPSARQESMANGQEGKGALRAHEALPHTPSGGKPPETPLPL